MKLKQAHVSLLLAIGIFGVAGSYAQQVTKSAPAPKTAKVTVNGVAIPQARIDLIAKERAAQGQPESPELIDAIRENLINQEVIAQAAIKKGLDKKPEIATQMDLARQTVLVRAYVQDYIRSNPINDETLKAEYEKFKAQLGDKEYKARHILVEKEDEAKDIIAQLKKGADFEKLAKEKSKDTGSRDNGGDLDWGPAARFVQPFAEALARLPKGQFSQEPVKTNFGYHVIRVDDVRELKAPAFEEVKENFRQRSQQEQLQKMLAELRSKAKIEVK